jgi:PhzF family phenazine biosynthesis protein
MIATREDLEIHSEHCKGFITETQAQKILLLHHNQIHCCVHINNLLIFKPIVISFNSADNSIPALHSNLLGLFMNILKIAAFSDGNQGGNPAGVLITDVFLPDMEMQRIAAEVGYSETVFAVCEGNAWRVRYFSPENEVPFCGHATIALGAALVLRNGDGTYPLTLNNGEISVEGKRSLSDMSIITATLQSPPTSSASAPAQLVSAALDLFGYTVDDLDPTLPPGFAQAGGNYLVLGLKTRKALANMKYDLNTGRTFMNNAGLTTILLTYSETPQLFHTRNPFASGGVYEDPATGAATAAFSGYLRDIAWPHGGVIDIVQGEDMGIRSQLRAEFSEISGSSIRVSGTARIMDQ